MSSNSESSPGAAIGFPNRCGCGSRVKKLTSATVENPGRPFFRCETIVKNHLFKWVEEAVLEEVVALKPRVETVEREVTKLRSDVDVNIFEIWDLHQEVLHLKKENKMVKIVLACFGVSTAMYMAYKLV